MGADERLRVISFFSDWAKLDIRSLALFRVLLGSILVLDLATRIPYITDFYTDDGVLPRSVLSQSQFVDEWLCFHLGVGHRMGILLLILLQIGLAISLAAGWRTKLATVGSWFMLNSLHVRNPFVNDRGDQELVLLLFWSIFLPLGATWSLDAKAGRKDWGSNTGLPAAALLLQLAQIYLFAGFLKQGDFWLVRGDGLYHSLKSPLFATGLAKWASTLPTPLLKAANYLVIVGEIFAGFLLLSPRSVILTRSLAIGTVAIFHLAVFALFDLGLFPLVGIIVLVALLPRQFWNNPVVRRLKWTGQVPEHKKEFPLWSRALVILAMFLTLLSNLAFRPQVDAFRRPFVFEQLSKALRLDQHWDLFSPIPPYNGQFEFISPDKSQQLMIPEDRDFPSHRWKMLMIASLYPRFALVRPGLVKRLPDVPENCIYRFQVKLVSRDGKSNKNVTWTLWNSSASGMKP